MTLYLTFIQIIDSVISVSSLHNSELVAYLLGNCVRLEPQLKCAMKTAWVHNFPEQIL